MKRGAAVLAVGAVRASGVLAPPVLTQAVGHDEKRMKQVPDLSPKSLLPPSASRELEQQEQHPPKQIKQPLPEPHPKLKLPLEPPLSPLSQQPQHPQCESSQQQQQQQQQRLLQQQQQPKRDAPLFVRLPKNQAHIGTFRRAPPSTPVSVQLMQAGVYRAFPDEMARLRADGPALAEARPTHASRQGPASAGDAAASLQVEVRSEKKQPPAFPSSPKLTALPAFPAPSEASALPWHLRGSVGFLRHAPPTASVNLPHSILHRQYYCSNKSFDLSDWIDSISDTMSDCGLHDPGPCPQWTAPGSPGGKPDPPQRPHAVPCWHAAC